MPNEPIEVSNVERWANDAAIALLCEESGLDADNEFERDIMWDTVFECLDVRTRYARILAQFIVTAMGMESYDLVA